MTGVQGFGQRAAGVGGGPSGLASSLDHLGIQVNPENVLKVRAVLMGEADRLKHDADRYEQQSMVGLCGGDPVSAQAMEAFNFRIRAFYDEVRGRIATFRAAGDALAVTAREYGRTEREIMESYRSTSLGDEWQPL